MLRYFCDYCGQEITGNSNAPCDFCIKTLKEALLEKHEMTRLPFGKVRVLLPASLLGDCSDEVMKLWFSNVLPNIREFGAAIEADEATRLPAKPIEPPNVTGDQSLPDTIKG